MPQNGQKASLRDVLNYNIDDYFTEDEHALIKNTFKDPRVIKVLRKALIPSFSDPELPLEQFSNDVWMAGRDYAQIPDDALKAIVLARQEAIKFIAGGIIQLKVMANDKEESEAEKAYRRSKDSTK